MNEMIQSGFDYAALPVDAALNARAAAERIKLRLKRTVEDIIEIGRELTAVKAELPHGQFLPWIAAEFEMQERTAYNFMDVSNRFGDKLAIIANLKPTILYALSAPSTPDAVIDKAVAKAESGEKVTVADVKDWKAIEAELEIEKRRSSEWREQALTRAKEKQALELQFAATANELHNLKCQPKPEPEIQVVETIPADYETAKDKAAKAEKELDKLKKEQTKLVADQVSAKLQGMQNEVNAMEQKKAIMQEQVDRMKAYMESLDSTAKRLEVHQDVIEKMRLELISLAAFLHDLDPIEDPATIKKWLALADMHQAAAESIRVAFGPRRPELSLVA